MADSKRVRISKREGALMARLSAKEQEVYEVQASARDLYRARRPVTDFARQVYTDPAINVEFQLLTAQLAEMENSLRLKEAELKELRTTADKADKDKDKEKGGGSAVKGPDGNGNGNGNGESTAARASGLVARCQRLEQENEELAASADVAKVAQLTSEKAVAEAYAGELKTALEEAYEYIEQLEEEREVASNKVYGLEEELRNVASQRRHYEAQRQQHHHQQQQQQQQQQEEHHHEDEPSWGEEARNQHHQEQQQHHSQNQRQQHQAGEGHEGLGQPDGSSRPGSNSSSGYRDGGQDAPPPPPPEAEANPAGGGGGGGGGGGADDMDDLYGDMSMDAAGGAYLADEGSTLKDDQMQQQEEEEEGGDRTKDGSPAGARTRYTRRATRDRK